MKAANNYGFKLVGCDLTHREKEQQLDAKLKQSMIYQEFGGMRVKAILFELGIPYDDNSVLQDAIDLERHTEMTKTFQEYVKLTDKPVLVIVGKHHVADSSSIHHEIKNISYGVMEIKN